MQANLSMSPSLITGVSFLVGANLAAWGFPRQPGLRSPSGRRRIAALALVSIGPAFLLADRLVKPTPSDTVEMTATICFI
jgi:hypothetical protein